MTSVPLAQLSLVAGEETVPRQVERPSQGITASWRQSQVLESVLLTILLVLLLHSELSPQG